MTLEGTESPPASRFPLPASRKQQLGGREKNLAVGSGPCFSASPTLN